jgi:hypothetical protein
LSTRTLPSERFDDSFGSKGDLAKPAASFAERDHRAADARLTMPGSAVWRRG